MEQNKADVLVAGAGAAGLRTALEIALTGRSVMVLEAKEHSGGRIHTAYTRNNLPVELGPEFIHGNLPLTQQLLKKAGIKTVPAGGSVWQYKNGELKEQEDFIEDYPLLEKKFKALKEDLPLSEFLSTHLAGENHEDLRFTLQNYVQGYYAADPARTSTFALRDELQKGDEEQYRVEGGYQKLISYLENECRRHSVRFFFSTPVKQLKWSKGRVEAVTKNGLFRASKALVTVSLGVLQAEGISFSPALPGKIAAANQLGFGHVVKLNLLFRERFWTDRSLTRNKNVADAGFVFSEEEIPTWWTQYPQQTNLLIGWLGGPKAKGMHTLSEVQLKEAALVSLSCIFSISVSHLTQNLQSIHFYDWSADPFTVGAYSFEVVDGEQHKKMLLQPVQDTVFFAGEGLYEGIEFGTVEAALTCGRDVAHNLIASFTEG